MEFSENIHKQEKECDPRLPAPEQLKLVLQKTYRLWCNNQKENMVTWSWRVSSFLWHLLFFAGILPTLEVDLMALGNSVRITRLCKLTKPQNYLLIHVQTLCGHSRWAARDQWSQMPGHLFSPPLSAEEPAALIRIQTHITGTVPRNVNVPMCMCECTNVCEIQGIIHCTSSGTSFSSPHSANPISALMWTLSWQRTHRREKKIKSAIRQKFPKVHITVLLSLIRQNKKYKKAERKKLTLNHHHFQ